MDVMSDVLLAVRLTGAVFFDVAARSPFVTESPSSAVIGPRVMADADHVIGFHVVTRGSCWAEAVDRSDPPLRLRAGEMVIYPAGDANTMTSAPGLRGHPDPALYDRPVDSALPFTITMHSDANTEECHFVCGFLGCDIRPFNPLLEALPVVVRAPVSPASWQWMAGLLDAAVQATGHGGAGREAMLAKLAELMFVEALRAHLESLPPDARGWVARPPGRKSAAGHPRLPVRGLEPRRPGSRGQHVALVVRGAVRGVRRHAADAVPHPLASPARLASPRGRPHGHPGRRGGRLPVRVCVHARLQAARRPGARRVAAEAGLLQACPSWSRG